jgi:hypothetical protein
MIVVAVISFGLLSGWAAGVVASTWYEVVDGPER